MPPARLLASSLAALVLPLIHSLGLRGRSMPEPTAQLAIADVAAIAALPLAIDPPNAGRAALIAVLAVALYFVLAWHQSIFDTLAVGRLTA